MIEIEVNLGKFSREFSDALAKQVGAADQVKRELAVSVREYIMDLAPYWSGKTKSTWFITPGMTPYSVRSTTQQGVYWPESSPSPDSLPETPFDWAYTVHTTNEYADRVNAGEFKDEHAMFVERGVDLAVSDVQSRNNKILIQAMSKPAKPTLFKRILSWFGFGKK